MTATIQPVRQTQYTVEEIEKYLNLKDTPFLRFMHHGLITNIQTGHLPVPLYEIPGWKDLSFRYIRTTDEWIPLFNFVGEDAQILALLDIEEGKQIFDNEFYYWATPKGYPDPQAD